MKSKEERLLLLEQKVSKLDEEVKRLQTARIDDLKMENKLLKNRLKFYEELSSINIKW